eukprot:993042-Amphidinium_carterae.1
MASSKPITLTLLPGLVIMARYVKRYGRLGLGTGTLAHADDDGTSPRMARQNATPFHSEAVVVSCACAAHSGKRLR